MLFRKNAGLLLSLLAIVVVSIAPIFTLREKNNFDIRSKGRNYNFVFNLDIVSKNNTDKIEIIEVKGQNTGHLSLEVIDCNNVVSNRKEGDKKTILCKCETNKNYTRIDSLRLRVNGKEKRVKLRFPIENRNINNIINIT